MGEVNGLLFPNPTLERCWLVEKWPRMSSFLMLLTRVSREGTSADFCSLFLIYFQLLFQPGLAVWRLSTWIHRKKLLYRLALETTVGSGLHIPMKWACRLVRRLHPVVILRRLSRRKSKELKLKHLTRIYSMRCVVLGLFCLCLG